MGRPTSTPSSIPNAPRRAKSRQRPPSSRNCEQKRGEAQALVEQLKEKPQDASLRQELKQTFETIRQEANLVADAKLEQQAKEALAALAAQTATAGTERFDKAVADIAPQAAPAAPPPAAPSAGHGRGGGLRTAGESSSKKRTRCWRRSTPTSTPCAPNRTTTRF
ncbi:MAG: hypothetical protein MZW92_63870 [Comamonadaceae bacterium]|nr:hypothetical protein [Comamonadaceae bacterium]